MLKDSLCGGGLIPNLLSSAELDVEGWLHKLPCFFVYNEIVVWNRNGLLDFEVLYLTLWGCLSEESGAVCSGLNILR